MADWLWTILKVNIIYHTLNLGMQSTTTFIVSDHSLFWSVELQALALVMITKLCDVVKTKYHVL